MVRRPVHCTDLHCSDFLPPLQEGNGRQGSNSGLKPGTCLVPVIWPEGSRGLSPGLSPGFTLGKPNINIRPDEGVETRNEKRVEEDLDFSPSDLEEPFVFQSQSSLNSSSLLYRGQRHKYSIHVAPTGHCLAQGNDQSRASRQDRVQLS
jgi:hypothetical protein